MDQKAFEQRLADIENRLNGVENKRVYERDIAPDVVKMRHMGEGVRYIRDGATADKPTAGEVPLQGAAVFYDYTTDKLWIYNRSSKAWKSVQLS